MNIKSLEFIHGMLQMEVVRANDDYRAARAVQRNYDEHGEPDEEKYNHQKAITSELRKRHLCACDALEDFESQEW